MISQPYGKIRPEGAGDCVVERVDGGCFLLFFVGELENDDDSLFRGDDPVLTDSGIPVFVKFFYAVHSGGGWGENLHDPVRGAYAAALFQFGRIADDRKIRFEIGRFIFIWKYGEGRNVNFTLPPCARI